MLRHKHINLLFLISVGYVLFDQTCGQVLDAGTALDMLTDSMKNAFKLEGVMKTFKKISEGMIPFPLFVPIVPKNKVMQLLKGKKANKDNQQGMDSLDQMSESSANLNKFPMQMQIPLPLMQQMMAKMNPNMAQMQQLNEQMFFNLRPTEMMPEMNPFAIGEGMNMPQIPINGQSHLQMPMPSADEVKPSIMNNDNDYEQSDNNDDNNDNNYAERFESGMSNQEYYSDEKRTPNAQDVMHNWQIIDEELKKIGQQLGKLGKYLNRN